MDRDFIRHARGLAARYRTDDGDAFRLKPVNPGDTAGLPGTDKAAAENLLRRGVETLEHLQDLLYAQGRWGLLLIFQGLDAAGKDGAIKHVMSGVNPMGCQVASFKAPSPEELDHDFLWRAQVRLPGRGRIGIFNRSYYEEVLVVRVHPELLAPQRLPASPSGKMLWESRFKDIRAFEHHLARSGVVVRKFFLHVSRAEQKRRLLARLDDPDKNWKYSPADIHERAYWPKYMRAYEDAIRATATRHAPWYVVPADNKWYARLVVAAAIVDTLASLRLAYPRLGRAARAGLAQARRRLLAQR
jgi:PPK2 family polyphosphate:nucleotide phosphotransferase